MSPLSRLRDHLRSRLWFLPAVGVLSAILLSVLTLALDRSLAGTEISFFLAFTGSAEAARTVLSVIAGTMLTLTALVFTILMVVLQLASSQFSPRVLRTFLRDRDSQYTLAVFVATFTYALLVLREVRSPTENHPEFVAGVSVTVAFGLVLLSIGLFISYINHIAQGIRVTTIIQSVAGETRRLIERLYPTGVDEPQPALLYEEPRGAPDLVVPSRHLGVVTAINEEKLVAAARGAESLVVLTAGIGDFVPAGGPLFEVHGGDPDRLGELTRFVHLDEERSMHEDPAFGFRQLVDIAEKALSPGINDPTTAVQVIDQLHDLLRRLAGRVIPPGAHFDEEGTLRLLVPVTTWEGYVSLACDELRHYGAGSMQVARRLRAMLEDLREAVPSGRIPAIERQLKLLDALVDRSFADLEDRDAAEDPDAQGLGS